MRNDPVKTNKQDTKNREKIFSELMALSGSGDPLEKRNEICNYIENMSSELSEIAVKSGEEFLGYLLNVAVAEARFRMEQIGWESSNSRKHGTGVAFTS